MQSKNLEYQQIKESILSLTHDSEIGAPLKPYIIAELGINHLGDTSEAQKLISAAADVKCDAVKFQYRNLDRTYADGRREIGDEILVSEIEKNYLSPTEILNLVKLAKQKSLEVGISFFTIEDMEDVDLEVFDFFKVPSAEFQNLSLIEKLISLGKPVYLSLGMQNQLEIDNIFSKIEKFGNWFPLHCVSNYPVATHNAQLGYLKFIDGNINRPFGYSSHDSEWVTCIAAISLGAKIIERHITLDKKNHGLDHSSSSTPDEFALICKFAEQVDELFMGDAPKIANQGEKLNKQNLGRSFYAKADLPENTKIDFTHFDYRNPATGLSYGDFNAMVGAPLLHPVKKGQALSKSHFLKTPTPLSDEEISRARRLRVSLPVRFGDFAQISSTLPVGSFEFHLSYTEILNESRNFIIDPSFNYSVHVPDYIDSNNLMDPWSRDPYVRNQSRLVISRTLDFATRLHSTTGLKIPVVASLSNQSSSPESFYRNLSALINEFENDCYLLTAQWLPPIAWYFGGSVKLEVMNSAAAAEELIERRIPLTMDYSHLILGRNFYGFNPHTLLRDLAPIIKHIHISDACGIDGEGYQIGEGDSQNLELFHHALKSGSMKVLEVWQGHLDGYAGFLEGIRKLLAIEDSA